MKMKNPSSNPTIAIINDNPVDDTNTKLWTHLLYFCIRDLFEMIFDATYSCLFKYNYFSHFLDNAMEMIVHAIYLGRIYFGFNSIEMWNNSLPLSMIIDPAKCVYLFTCLLIGYIKSSTVHAKQ